MLKKCHAIHALMLIWVLLLPLATQAQTEHYSMEYLPETETMHNVSAMTYHDGALYIALWEYERVEDASRYSGSLLRYDLEAGTTELLFKDKFPVITSLAVFGDKAIIATQKLIQNETSNLWQVDLVLIEVTTGAVLDKISMTADNIDNHWYNIASIPQQDVFVVTIPGQEGMSIFVTASDESMLDGIYDKNLYNIKPVPQDKVFVVAMPGKGQVLCVTVNDDNRLRESGVLTGMREVKGLFMYDDLLYVGGSTRVNHETRGAIYVVDDGDETELFMTVMESRGGFNSVWIKDGLLIATNYYNVKLFQNSIFVFDLETKKLLAEIKDPRFIMARVCHSKDTLYFADWHGGAIAAIKFDLAGLKNKKPR